MSSLIKQDGGFVEPEGAVGEDFLLDAIKKGEHVFFGERELNEIGHLISTGKASRLLAYAWATIGLSMALDGQNSPFCEGPSRDGWRARLDLAEDSCLMLDRFCEHFKHYPVVDNSFRNLSAIYRQRIALAIPILLGAEAEERRSREVATVWTYFIQHPKTSLIKIGKSVCPESRLLQLEGGAGARLKLLGSIAGDKEKELHEKFAHLRQHGEWFEDRNGAISKLVVFLGGEGSNE